MSSYQQSNVNESLAAELCTPLPYRRQFFTNSMNSIAFIFSVLALLPLISLVWEILVRGLPNLIPNLFR